MRENPSELIHLIAQTLYAMKGENIIAIDVRGISSITDIIMIVQGNVDRHVIALAKGVEEALRKIGQKPSQVDGMQNGDWVVLDYFQVVVHIFTPEMREKYQLERLWPDGKVIDLDLNLQGMK